MYIHEAIAATKVQPPVCGPYIRRAGWPYGALTRLGHKILATNAPGGCIAYSKDLPPEKWVPTEDDLKADDWEPCF